MPDKKKLVVLGGSSIASPILVQDLLDRSDRPPFEVCLIGRTRPKLDKVAAACASLVDGSDPPVEITFETDLTKGLEGLEGADYILNQIRVSGYKARAYDERFPRQFGIPGEETFGPGGMNNAKRTIPVVLEYCKAVEQFAPDALVLNLTNPFSFIQYAAVKYSNVNIIGVCDSPVGIGKSIAKMLSIPYKDLWFQYVGMHHFGWVTQVFYHGKDLMPSILEKLAQVPGLPVDPDIAKAIGGIPTSYFKYFYHANRIIKKQSQQEQVRAEQLLAFENKVMDAYDASNGKVPSMLGERGAHWYRDIVLPVMLAHINGTNEVFTLNVVNESTISWLPKEAIIETPTVVSSHGFIPLQPGHTPIDLQAMVRLNATIEMLWVEAVVEQDYGKALRAMMLNHLVHDLDTAKSILDEIWDFD